VSLGDFALDEEGLDEPVAARSLESARSSSTAVITNAPSEAALGALVVNATTMVSAEMRTRHAGRLVEREVLRTIEGERDATQPHTPRTIRLVHEEEGQEPARCCARRKSATFLRGARFSI
jgi:hypothetical protein